MISCCYLTEFEHLKEYIDEYLLDLLNPDGQSYIPRIYGVDRFLEFKNKHGKTVGIIKYTPIGDSSAVSFHPMFRNEHKIYTLKCIQAAFDWIESEGYDCILFVFPACNPAAEKMAKHVGAKMVNEIPDDWRKNDTVYPTLVYRLELGNRIYERPQSFRKS